MIISQMLKNRKGFLDDGKWLKDLQADVNFTKQEKLDMTEESLKILRRMPNWKSLGQDLVQGFCLNGFCLAMIWIDYRKTCDMVPHLWIKECLDLFRVAESIKALLVNIIEKWRVMLCAKKSELREVDIKQGIFQGDYLSPLVFIDPIKFDFKEGQGSIRVFR